ncbi:hypothetical protein HYT92_02855 [Candidatus Pacearchaeota archaeon]|nr:hypothetical protein [Candidatus Pacearchaeota archaeon]
MNTEIICAPSSNEIVWEKNIIRIPFNSEDERDRRIFSLIQNLQEEIERLKSEKSNFDFLSLTNEQAKTKIIKYLKIKKMQGNGKVDIFEISSSLKVPAQQVEDIIEKDLIKQGLLKEV